jgi:hydrogenase expression/formation protein HypE
VTHSQIPVGKVPPDLLASLVYAHLGARRDDVLVHAQFGEDCAAVAFGDEVAVLTTDPITGTQRDLGWYAVHVATNDLAACGAEPVALVLTLLLAPDRPADDLARVMRDASDAARAVGVEIAGGHTEVTQAVGRTVAVVTALGRAGKGRMLRSGGARPGDALLLTKGAGIEGTAILATELADRLRPVLAEDLLARARAFRDRISVLPEGRAAAAAGARAMHDVTEGGVLGAVYEMAVASRIGVRLDADRVPVLPETRALCGQLGANVLGLIGSGALLVATPDPARTAAAIEAAGVPVERIGEFLPEGRWVRRGGSDRPFPPPARDELWRVLEAAGSE